MTRSVVQRTKRLEFSKKVRLEIFLRAGGPDKLRCEGKDCGLPIKGSNFEIDHTLECWEMEDVEHGYREALTAEDGKLLCIPCHDAKTGKKAGERARCKKVVEKAAKARKPKQPFKGWRKFDGSVVWNDKP
jgi:hypothetical protein